MPENFKRKPNCECCACGRPHYTRPSEKTDHGLYYCRRGSACHKVWAVKVREARDELYIERWLFGEENGMRGKLGIAAQIRRWLFKKNRNSCSSCGWGEVNPFTGNVPLEVHHIDGCYTNNRPENIDLLCPNCHSLTESFRACNTGKGRPRK